jgi:cytochrome c peroxidase
VCLLALGCAGGPLPVAPPVLDPDLVQRGGLVFMDARLSRDGAQSCATCHPGGSTDRKLYDGRDTPSLRGAWATPPYLRDGSVPTLRAAIELMLAREMGGADARAADVAALEAYVASLPPFRRGRTNPDGSPGEPHTLRMKRGFELFSKSCAGCHPAPSFSDRRAHDVGTGGTLDTPTLLGIAESAPYGHDARFASLEEATRAMARAAGAELSDLEVEYLLEYLKLL